MVAKLTRKKQRVNMKVVSKMTNLHMLEIENTFTGV